MKTLNELLEAIEGIKQHHESIKGSNAYFRGGEYVINDVPPSVVAEAAKYFFEQYRESNGKLQLMPFHSHVDGFSVCIWSTPCKAKTIFEEV